MGTFLLKKDDLLVSFVLENAFLDRLVNTKQGVAGEQFFEIA